MTAAAEQGHPRRWSILAVLVLALLVAVLDNTVLNVALRTIADPVAGIGASQAQLEWAINSYTLVFAGLLFAAGILGDRFGRRRVLLIGLALFGSSSLLSAYAQTPLQLVGARALMGLGAAALMPSTLSIISNVFHPSERGRAIGVWASAVGLAVAIGPVTGGLLLEHFWWGSVFLINVPIITVAVVLVLVLVPESRDPDPGRLDLIGVLLSVTGLMALVYGIIDGGEHGIDRPVVFAAIGVGLALLVWFVWYERRIRQPSLDIRLFSDARFSAAIAAIGLVFFAAVGTLFFLTFYLQLVRGFSPLRAGLLMTPFALAQLIFAPRSAAMVRRYGPRAVCTVGLSLVTVALAGYAFLGITTPVWVLLIITFVHGTGMANVVPPTTESIMSSLPPERAGVGSAVSNTFRQVGAALGVAVLGSVLAAVYRHGVGDALAGLAEPARAEAAESISGAYGVAARVGPEGAGLLAAANHAFVAAMHWAAGAAALVAALGAAAVFAFLPRHANPHHDRREAPRVVPRTRARSAIERLYRPRRGVRAEVTVRVLGVDPGLTRCGVGVVDGQPGRTCRAVAHGVVRTDPEDDLAARLLALDAALTALIAEHRPDEVAVERVFSQHNVRTVMGTAQAAAVAVLAAARAGLPVRSYTPSEVKAAVTGSGQADKAQVTMMVTRLLRLPASPRPADAADALALAICHVWRGGTQARIEAAARRAQVAGSATRAPAVRGASA